MLCLVLCSFKDTRIRLCISILNSCDHHFERVSAAMRFPSPGCRCPSAWFRNTAGLSCDRFGSGFSNGFPKSATVNLSMFYPFGSGFSNGFPMVFQCSSSPVFTDTRASSRLPVVSCQEDALSPGLEDEPEDPEEDEDGKRYPLVMSK